MPLIVIVPDTALLFDRFRLNELITHTGLMSLPTIHENIAGLAELTQSDNCDVILETFMKNMSELPSPQERIELLEKVNICLVTNGKKPIQDQTLRLRLNKFKKNNGSDDLLESFMNNRTNLPSTKERIELLEKVNLCLVSNGKDPIQDHALRVRLNKM